MVEPDSCFMTRDGHNAGATANGMMRYSSEPDSYFVSLSDPFDTILFAGERQPL